jgi:predicted O-methyltransferase YrrM
MLQMGHGQSADDNNLGLGWLYYALARMQKCACVVVIGSAHGFVPLVLAKALADNACGGRVVFIDPSLASDFWTSPDRVESHFLDHGIHNVTHHLATTQEFVKSQAYADLGQVDLLFVDGMHTREQAKFDHESFRHKLSPGAFVLFHDSIRKKRSRIYGKGKTYETTVVAYMDELKDRKDLQVMDFPFGSGLTLVRETLP